MDLNDMQIWLELLSGIALAAVILILQFRLMRRAPSNPARLIITLVCIAGIWVLIPVVHSLVRYELRQLPGVLLALIGLLVLLKIRIHI